MIKQELKDELTEIQKISLPLAAKEVAAGSINKIIEGIEKYEGHITSGFALKENKLKKLQDFPGGSNFILFVASL